MPIEDTRGAFTLPQDVRSPIERMSILERELYDYDPHTDSYRSAEAQQGTDLPPTRHPEEDREEPQFVSDVERQSYAFLYDDFRPLGELPADFDPRERRAAPPRVERPRYVELRNETKELRERLKQMHPDLTIPWQEKDDSGRQIEYRTVKKVWEKATSLAEQKNRDLSNVWVQLGPNIQQAIQRKTRRPRA